MTHDKYDTDILKTLKSIDASLKNIAKSVQPVNTTVIIDNNSEEAVILRIVMIFMVMVQTKSVNGKI